MVEFDGAGDFGGGASDDDDDDIARFERQCAERARAEGLGRAAEEDAPSDDEPDAQIRRVRIAAGLGPSPTSSGDWRERCEVLQERLAHKDAELNQVRADLDLLRNDGLGPNDPGNELKQRLLELTKKSRRMQVKLESQKTRIQQLEAEVKKPREEARRQAEEMVMKTYEANLGEGMEDWKKKYLTASNKLQEVRHETQDLRAQLQRQKKVLLKELGSEEAVEKALSVVDDPHDTQWRGRATQISQLQRQVRDLRDQLRRPGAAAEDAELGGAGAEAQQRLPRGRADQVSEKESKALAQAAEKRREEFEKLHEEAEKLRNEAGEVKRKRDALKSRNGVLEGQLRELKASVQDLLRKSDNDDALVAALRRQLGRHGPGGGAESRSSDPTEVEALREENQELQAQLERQAKIVVQLRQKSLSNACENGSAKLGPRSVEAAAGERQLIERVRYLEADNARHLEQVKLLQARLGNSAEDGGVRPFSAEGTMNLQEKLRQMNERLVFAERENHALRQQQQRTMDLRAGVDLSPSGHSSHPSFSRSSSHGVGGFGMVVG